jgi:hypothetical protein
VFNPRRMRWTRHAVRRVRGEVYTGFGGKTWGKETTWKTRRRSEVNIKMDRQEVGCGGMDSIDVAQVDRWRALVSHHKMRGISWQAENRLASQEGLCSLE